MLRAKKIIYMTNAYSIIFPELYKYQIFVFMRIVLTKPLIDEQVESIGWGNRVRIEESKPHLLL